jgi:phosphate/sulfate permease
VTNGAGGDADVPADTYNIKITAAGDASTVAFDADLNLAEGSNTIAYAIGSVAGGSFQVVANTITGLQSAPEGVPTGTGGLAGSSNMLPVALLAIGLLGLAGGTALVARRDNV